LLHLGLKTEYLRLLSFAHQPLQNTLIIEINGASVWKFQDITNYQ